MIGPLLLWEKPIAPDHYTADQGLGLVRLPRGLLHVHC